MPDEKTTTTDRRLLPGMRRAANILRRDAGEAYSVADDKKAKWLRRAARHVEEEIRLSLERTRSEGWTEGGAR